MSQEAIGILMLCLCSLAPFALGIGATLWWQRRLARVGWPGALLPGIVRKWVERNS